MKLNTKAFALARGLIWDLGIFFLTWWVILFEGSTYLFMGLGRPPGNPWRSG